MMKDTRTIDDILADIDHETHDTHNSVAGTYWDSFDCQIQCEEFNPAYGYGEDTYFAIQEYLAEQREASY